MDKNDNIGFAIVIVVFVIVVSTLTNRALNHTKVILKEIQNSPMRKVFEASGGA